MENNNIKKVAILGSTGSIGRQVIDVASRMKDRIQITALTANKNAAGVAEQARDLGVTKVGITDANSIENARNIFNGFNVKLYEGIEGICDLVQQDEIDIVVVAVAGVIGLRPTLCAIAANKTIALASKEVLVAGGEIVTQALKKNNVNLLPIDSEHSAIFQCLQGALPNQVERIFLTASGGPFANKPVEAIRKATVDDALRHPTWNMGALVTINSATLMNKGLEVIEAQWLFGLPCDQIDVIVHPQSIVHSMVRFHDGSTIAQLGLPDMRLPIQYALIYPERPDTGLPKLDITKVGSLTFSSPELERFPCLELAYRAGRIGKTMPVVMNGANEAVVDLFLQHKLGFLEIPKVIQTVMSRHEPVDVTLDSILSADRWARETVYQIAKVPQPLDVK